MTTHADSMSFFFLWFYTYSEHSAGAVALMIFQLGSSGPRGLELTT